MRRRLMIRLLCTAMIATPATPVISQDWSGGSMDSHSLSAPMVVEAATEAQARHLKRSGSSTKGSPARSRQICSDARSKVKGGDKSPRLPRLLALCRKGGY